MALPEAILCLVGTGLVAGVVCLEGPHRPGDLWCIYFASLPMRLPLGLALLPRPRGRILLGLGRILALAAGVGEIITITSQPGTIWADNRLQQAWWHIREVTTDDLWGLLLGCTGVLVVGLVGHLPRGRRWPVMGAIGLALGISLGAAGTVEALGFVRDLGRGPGHPLYNLGGVAWVLPILLAPGLLVVAGALAMGGGTRPDLRIRPQGSN